MFTTSTETPTDYYELTPQNRVVRKDLLAAGYVKTTITPARACNDIHCEDFQVSADGRYISFMHSKLKVNFIGLLCVRVRWCVCFFDDKS